MASTARWRAARKVVLDMASAGSMVKGYGNVAAMKDGTDETAAFLLSRAVLTSGTTIKVCTVKVKTYACFVLFCTVLNVLSSCR